MPAVHPAPDQLSDFALGRLEPAAIGVIEEHLSACGACCDTLRQLQPDTFVSLVREAGGGQAVGATVTVDGAATAPDVPAGVPAELADHPRYRVVGLLGTGGMGAVYLAEHRRMQRVVALKVISPRLVASPSAVERFQREVKAAARLNHPNIVTAHDADQAGDLHFFVMEYVRGTDLNVLLDARGRLPVAEACEYARQAALGLQHAHENGMTHRDIKPHNLMVVPGPAPQVKILDFGLASLVSEAALPVGPDAADPTGELTGAGAVMGTPDYMAPEQGRDARSADIRSDVYSLGCTLYTLLTGEVPFPGGTPLEKVQAHAERTPRPASELRPDLPPGLARVLDRMMARDPAQRYQTPAEAAAALAPFAAPVKRSRRRPALVTAALALAATIVLGVVYVKTDAGTLTIESKADDVQVVVSRNGQELEVLDLKSGTTVRRLPSGNYEVRPKGADVTVEGGGFKMTRGGQVVVEVKHVPAQAPVAAGPKPRRKLSPTDEIAPAHRQAIDKGLAYLVRAQHKDGSWEGTGGTYRVPMTALAGMALLMEGSTPDSGAYAEPLRKAVEWLLARAQPTGLLADPADKSEMSRYTFGHGYSMLFLASVYGLEPDGDRKERLEKVLKKAVEFSGSITTPRGGWGYVAAKDGGNFDESATTIVQLQGLRAARKAGLTVPRELLDADFMRKSTGPDGGVVYSLSDAPGAGRPALTAAALSVGEFDSTLAKRWLAFCQKTLPLSERRRVVGFDTFTQYYYAQGIYLLGEAGYGKLFPTSREADRLTWSRYRKLMFDALASEQAKDGSWLEPNVGPVYGTACTLAVLQLDAAAVPIYRR